jgi:uncharacterized delta-60 repeat protein
MKTMLHCRKIWMLSSFILLANIGFSQLTQEWVARYNGTGSGGDVARSLVVDHNGNVYVTGTVTDTASGLDYRTIKYNAAGQEIWKAKWNGAANGDDEPFSIALDSWGNVYVTGRSMGNGTGYDFATVKYNSAGIRQWSVRYNDPHNGFDQAKSIAVDGYGNVYVTGEGGLGGSDPNSNSDYVTIKYNTNGTRLWVATYDGPGRNDAANALTLDKYGNVYVTGRSPAGIDLDEQDMDYATIKYNNNGQQLWVRRYDGPYMYNEYDEALDIKVDGSGNVYVTGRSAASNLESSNDYATVKYDANGNEKWSARYNGPGNSTDDALALVVDASQNVYVTGYSAAGPNETNFDYATIKYNMNGQEVWVKRYNGPANDQDQAGALALDKNGNIYVTGRSMGAGTGYDFATVKYDPAGNQQSVARYNGPGNSSDGTAFLPSHPIAVDENCNVYITGSSTGTGTGADITTIKYSQPDAAAPALITSRTDTIPATFRVFVAPNPVAVTTRLTYELPVEGKVSIAIYDMLGRKILTLLDATQPAGSHVTYFNVATIPTGIYSYQVVVKTSIKTFSQAGMVSVIK